MNTKDRITPDLPFDPPVDGLEMVIDALDNVIPVFGDRLERGVNTRYLRPLADFLSRQAQDIAMSTQYARRKQIIPATPQLIRLKEAALKADGEIHSLRRQESASENANAAGRRFLVGVSQGHVRDVLNAITRLESHWGSFDIWIKKPKWATCDRILAALVNRDPDGEDYLAWFLTNELKRNRSLSPYVASVLWAQSGRWREWDESNIYPRIIRRAHTRKYWDGRDAEWLNPQPNTISLSELRKLPELVSDPLEFLFSREGPTKLRTLKEMSDCLAFDGRLDGLNLTHDELKYFKLKKIYGLKQVEVRDHLRWDDATLQRVKRATDRKLRQVSSKQQI